MSNTTAFEELFSAPLRNGVSYPTRLRGTGIPMINMKEIFAFDRIGDQECELVPLTQAEFDSSLLEAGDLLFARQSLTFEGAGKCALVLPSGRDRTWESHLIRVRLDPQIASPAYYYYYFRSPQGRQAIEAIIQQVAAAGIRGSDLRKLQVPHVAMEEQRAIAEVLGALDDKIASNARLVLTADSWVRVVYKEVQARTDEQVTLDKLVDLVKDLVHPSAVPADTAYVGLEHISRRVMWLSSCGTTASIASTKWRFAAGDILFGKLRSYFHKVVSAPVGGLCSTDVLVVRPSDENIADFVLAAISSDEVVERCAAASKGTRMPRTSWKDLAAVKVAWPGEVAAYALSEKVLSLRNAAEAHLRENNLLAAMRDALLPDLMSGKVRVKDAEKIAEEVL